MRKIFVYLILFLYADLIAQDFSISKIEPPDWRAGMKHNKITLMIYGENLAGVQAKSANDDFQITAVVNAENDHYLFVEVKLKEKIAPGKYKLIFEKAGKKKSLFYEIKKREFPASAHRGFSSEDVIYLITPDRFCNGDATNDYIEGQLDKYPKEDLNGRHGGDIVGIIKHLDYIKKLGATAIWITPLLENNMPMSYHGYAITDLYKIDPRFGDNELYKKLVAEAHKRGLKVIFDHVANHIGINSYWVKERPFADWIHGSGNNPLITNHGKESLTDPHKDERTYEINTDGWFTDYMPDLNQKNKYLAEYIIQNTIWRLEYSGIDGIREDTYSYSDRNFMSRWAKEILTEYPNLNIVGEVWKGIPSMLAVNQAGNNLAGLPDTYLPCVTDFAFADAVRNYISGKGSLRDIYDVFAQDFLYSDYNNLLVFSDNHDLARTMFMAGGDMNKFFQALTLVLTTRGIPQIYYGTELGLKGFDHHGSIRANFPGGFPGDSANAFTREGRTERQNKIYDWLHNLLSLRSSHKALSSGKFVQYPIRENYYFYFKFADSDSLAVFLNGSEKSKTIRFDELNSRISVLQIKKLEKIFPEKESPRKKEIRLNPFAASIYKVN